MGHEVRQWSWHPFIRQTHFAMIRETDFGIGCTLACVALSHPVPHCTDVGLR